MKHIARSVLSPLWSILFIMLSVGFYLTFLSLRVNLDGYDEIYIGLIHSSYYLGLLLGCLRIESIIRRIGHIRAFSAFASVCAVTILLQALIANIWVWIALRFLAGICLAALYVAIESWLLDKSTLETRGRILSLYMITIYVAQSMGQFIINRVDIQTLQPFIIASLLCSISIVPVAITRSKSPDIYEPTLTKIVSFLKSSPFGFLGCVLSGFVISSIYSFTPNFAEGYDLDVPIVVSLAIGGGVVLQWPIGKISDLIDRRKVLLFVSLITIIPALTLFFNPSNMKIVYPVIFLLGGFCFTLYPLSITQVCDRIDHHNITAVTSALLFAYGIGAALGPVSASQFMQYFGPNGLFIYISLICIILFIGGIFAILRKKSVPFEEQQSYYPLPRLTPVAYELDPRQEDETQT